MIGRKYSIQGTLNIIVPGGSGYETLLSHGVVDDSLR